MIRSLDGSGALVATICQDLHNKRASSQEKRDKYSPLATGV